MTIPITIPITIPPILKPRVADEALMATGVRVGTLVGAERVMDLKVEVVEVAEGGVVVLGAAVDTTTALIVG